MSDTNCTEVCARFLGRGACWEEHQASSMATSTGEDRKLCSTSDVDLLLHPELLSQEFMQLILREVSQCSVRNVKLVR